MNKKLVEKTIELADAILKRHRVPYGDIIVTFTGGGSAWSSTKVLTHYVPSVTVRFNSPMVRSGRGSSIAARSMFRTATEGGKTFEEAAARALDSFDKGIADSLAMRA